MKKQNISTWLATPCSVTPTPTSLLTPLGQRESSRSYCYYERCESHLCCLVFAVNGWMNRIMAGKHTLYRHGRLVFYCRVISDLYTETANFGQVISGDEHRTSEEWEKGTVVVLLKFKRIWNYYAGNKRGEIKEHERRTIDGTSEKLNSSNRRKTALNSEWMNGKRIVFSQ